MIRLALIAVMSLGTPPGNSSVHGTIESDRYEAVGGVRIDIPAQNIVAWSDSTGAYRVEGLEPGEYEIRFSQFGYHPLELQITVPHDGSLSLDVRLRTRFIVFPEISALAYASLLDPGEVLEPSGLPEIGSRVLTGEVLWSDPLAGQPDVFEILSIIPGIDMAEESPTQLHVRGGSADQNLILLDGAPVYNPYHTSGILSAITPDAVSEVAIHTGVFPARYGGRLSSVVNVATPEPGQAGLRVKGGAGLADVRMTVDAPIPGAAGGVLIGGRRTRYDLLRRGSSFEKGRASGFDDLLGKVSLDLLGGRFDIVSLSSDNWLLSQFDDEARVSTEAQDAVRNSVIWSASTNAVAWSRSSDNTSEIRLQVWRATTDSDVHWGANSGRYQMVNALKHWGVSGDLSWVRPATVGRAGFTVEALSSTYATDPLTSETVLSLADADPVLDLRSSQKMVSTYLEHRWIARDQWIVNNGMRAVFADRRGVALEPRFSVHYRPDARVTLSGGYARVHQYVQSLRNAESLLTAAFGAEPLVTADAEIVPVGRSDQLTAAFEARLSSRLVLTVDGHVRWLDDLVLVAPVTAQPFAINGFEQGKGRAIGTGAALFYRGDRVDAEAIVEWSRVERQTGDITYNPGFERRRTLMTAASYRLTPQTKVRTAFQAAAGRPTSLIREGFDWGTFDRLSGEVEFSGTPLRVSETVNGERLPSYVRLDVGIRREWNPSLFGLSGSVMAYLDVTNVLGRENAVGYAITPSEPERRGLHLLPASATFGLEWSF